MFITPIVRTLLIIVALLGWSQVSTASVQARGTFHAVRTCQAYQSIEKQTNPGQTRLTIGQNYPILEANTPKATTWYLIDINGATPQQRWVYFECGKVNKFSVSVATSSSTETKAPKATEAKSTPSINVKSHQSKVAKSHEEHAQPTEQKSVKTSSSETKKPIRIPSASTIQAKKPRVTHHECSTAGHEDSYLFAVSWAPAFCEAHPSKPECQVTDPSSFQARNFTLHGLWPNKASCGTRYGFCGTYSKSKYSFCDYAPVDMKASTLAALGEVMPSAAYGSCLQRHEWYKHGTCQTKRNADEYYILAMHLLEQFNASGITDFMHQNEGKTVTSKAFFAAVDKAFFVGARNHLQISCTDNKLTDIYITLPETLSNDVPLKSLMQQAPEKFANKCGNIFEIDKIGY